ncbi:30S ribosomal protein S6 [Candidatus Woesebacteria bacterium RBG_19FT_COMBO_47_8]|uniref:Small ribosomal subunit protein bS6 n=1 Tax=Candidatus Woesebacteria bacterium RBG_13_46_13 TaxID=1802479 RepID=A0A1F7X6J2_9BACT|nr:MAG: 30S ribosomal protein S6 [Candidatus Woesebacteria bacterium RBG_13_46_13]OGM18136.1 MAG: 30S ribosomal protein S6 [Candidatus Woesebacteria bacterium RBG_19FT_COMBO_47_8]HJX59493.1 30S ribosomal protein S6 [Patescibacteria group bacterium]
MQKYELTIVFDAKISAAKRKAVREAIEKAVGLLKGKIGAVADWGEKDLAGKIKKATRGYYIYFPLELSSDSAKKLLEKMKSEDAIIRYLLVREK